MPQFFKATVNGRTLPRSKGKIARALSTAKRAAAKGADSGPTFRVEACRAVTRRRRGRKNTAESCGTRYKVFKHNNKVIVQ